ncbi:FAD:protein FMN transferase [Croceicoccus sp. F390]|uniref:FAD:protein FMN transferase n=1 Tax=Croceicoccus esteveae TaxID=3075597 RepID=A0ABU2ZDQ0_9SPHN|nr:FAD:protein FMN transferase [Croceicoccus sp. F390]MDT0574730.1 FAD:protein FMN transferase [Croceicoccus sp. F390]
MPLRNELRLSGETMGTCWSLCAALVPGVNADHVEDRLHTALASIIAQMSQWEPASQLSLFNAAAQGTRLAIGPQFVTVLQCALAIGEASDGAFNPALGRQAAFWGFGPTPLPAHDPAFAPASAPPVTAMSEYGWAAHVQQGAIMQTGGVMLDLSGIAKGFAVDHVLALLQEIGVRDAFCEIGGEAKGIGQRSDGLPWWVDLEVPPGSAAAAARIGLSGWAVATTGNYLRRQSRGASSWSHTLDPATGCPVDDGMIAVSVLHPGCMQADALATAIMVMGARRGMDFATRCGIPARIVTSNKVLLSPAWQQWLN